MAQRNILVIARGLSTTKDDEVITYYIMPAPLTFCHNYNEVLDAARVIIDKLKLSPNLDDAIICTP